MKENEVSQVLLRERRLACENSKFEIFFDYIEQANGESVKDYLVVLPRVRTAEMMTGVSVLPVVDGKIALIRMYRHPIGEYVWEIPRGFIDEGEEAVVSARRELEEETGLTCAEQGMLPLGWMAPEAGVLAAKMRLYAAFDCVRTRAFVAEELGHCGLHLFETSEVDAMIMASEIMDPSTIIAYFKYRAICSNG